MEHYIEWVLVLVVIFYLSLVAFVAAALIAKRIPEWRKRK